MRLPGYGGIALALVVALAAIAFATGARAWWMLVVAAVIAAGALVWRGSGSSGP